MSDVNDPLAWVERAEEDYAVARVSIRRKRPLPTVLAFMRNNALPEGER